MVVEAGKKQTNKQTKQSTTKPVVYRRRALQAGVNNLCEPLGSRATAFVTFFYFEVAKTYIHVAQMKTRKNFQPNCSY